MKNVELKMENLRITPLKLCQVSFSIPKRAMMEFNRDKGIKGKQLRCGTAYLFYLR